MFRQAKEAFEKSRPRQEKAILRFEGVEGFDVYNCSIPFSHQGKDYIYGRVERRGEWARSWVRLFEKVGPDHYRLVPGTMVYQLEDPYIAWIGGEMVMGGTHVVMRSGRIDHFRGYFYRGQDLEDLKYFTTGPRNMKDIRLVQLKEGIGVFSRPRSEEIKALHGSESTVGFALIQDLMELDEGVIEKAAFIPNMFAKDEWGGCNQCYALDSGLIGIIGHKSYPQEEKGVKLAVYTNVSFVFDPRTNRIVGEKIIATRSSFPDAPAKLPALVDCAFASGIALRPDGKADLYSGIGDTHEGRVVIEYPFEGFGKIVQY